MHAEAERIERMMREDELNRTRKNPLLEKYSESQRLNIYCGRSPGPSPKDPPRAGWISNKSRFATAPAPLTVQYPDDKVIDSLIQEDEAEMSRAGRFHTRLYGSGANRSGALPLVETAEEKPKGLLLPTVKREVPTCFGHLSNYPMDGIREPRTEEKLWNEYERSKREQTVMDLIAEEGSEDDSDDDEETRVARTEARQLKDQKKRRKELYERIRSSKKQTGDAKQDPSAPTFTYSNSKMPGPYFTINQKGEHTRFEALYNRFHMYRSPQRIWSRNEALHQEENSQHTLQGEPKQRGKKVVDPNTILPTGETERLRRWKYQTGILE